MRGKVMSAGAAVVLFSALVLGGCTERVSERCSGSDGEYSCTLSYAKSDGQWSTELEGSSTSTEAVLSGTFTIESGSGTVYVAGADSSYEYPISAEQPVVIEDLALSMIEEDSDTWIYLKVTADPQIDGFSAELTYRTS